MAASKPEKPKAAEKKVMDVAKPGKSAPTSTSKPVIVGHKPMIQDPMVTPSEGSEEATPAKEEKVTPVRTTKKIIPLSEQTEEAADKDASTEEPADTAEETAEDKVVEDEADEAAPVDESAKDADVPAEESDEKPTTDESAAVEAIASQANKRREGDLTEEEKKKIEAINKLIEDKTYYLKIGQAHQRRNSTLIGILALILLLIIGGAFAIDAGLIQSDLALPFDLIPN